MCHHSQIENSRDEVFFTCITKKQHVTISTMWGWSQAFWDDQRLRMCKVYYFYWNEAISTKWSENIHLSWWIGLLSRGLFALNVCWDSISLQTSNLIQSIVKDAAKIVSSLHQFSKSLTPAILFSLQKPDETEVLLTYLSWSCQILTCLSWFNSKSVYAALCMMNYFPHYNTFPTEKTLQASHYSISIFIASILTCYIPCFHQLCPLQLGPVMPHT